MFNLKIAFQRGEKKFHVKMLQTSWFHSNSLPKGVQFYPNSRKPNETPYRCFVNFLHRTRKASIFCCGVLFLEHDSNFSAAEWNVLILPLPRNSNIFLITCFSLASLFFFHSISCWFGESQNSQLLHRTSCTTVDFWAETIKRIKSHFACVTWNGIRQHWLAWVVMVSLE